MAADLRALVRGVAPLFVSVGLLNVSNYAFHLVATRILGPSLYGGLSGLLAFLLILSVPCGVLQAVVAKRWAVLRADGAGDGLGSLTIRTTRALTLIGAVAAGGLVIASPVVAALLHVGILPAVLLAPYALFALVSSVPLGALQGQKRFVAFGVATSVGVIARFIVGVVLMYAGWGIVGALVGSVLAQALVLAVSVYQERLPGSVWRAEAPSTSGIRGEVASTLAAVTGFWLLAEADLVLARHYLDAEASGVYGAAGILARAILFLPSAISLVALPHFAEAARDVERSRRWLHLSLIATGALALGAAALLAVFGRPLLSLTFGARYAAGAGVLRTLAPAMACLALTNVLLYFHIAAGSRAYRLVFVGLVAEIFLVVLAHGTGPDIALVTLGVAGTVSALLWHGSHAVLRWRPACPASIPDVGPDGHRELDLSIVLPCHNAEGNLGEVLDRLTRIGAGVRREIVVVSDGSTDATVAVAEAHAADGVRVLSYRDRVGKGHALRVGLGETRGRYVAFMDADGDIDPGSLQPLLEIARLYEPEVVLGSKRHPLSDVHYPPLRRLLSWVYHKLTRALFRVNVRDTQAGLKLVRRDVLLAVLPRMLEKRFAFDLELLVVARRLGYTAVFEAPIRLDYRFASHVDARAASRILVDTLAIFYRRFVLDTYRSDPGSARVRRHASGSDGHPRILIVNWRDIRNPDAGGAEAVTHEVARRWVDRGCEVTLLTSRFPGARKRDSVDGVRIRRIGRLRAGTFHLRVQWALATLDGYDVVIDEINTIPFFTPLWRRRLPPIVGLIHQLARDVWDVEMPRPIAAVGRSLERRMLCLYRDVPMLTVSESTKRDLEEIGLRDVHVIPQGRDEPAILDVEKESEPTFLFVGRLTANKRPEHAIDAFRLIREELPTARLWIVGRGPLERSLRRRLPTGAEMLGFLSRDELYRRMARAHCLLVTSVREGWGLVITEANGVGTPAVGYDVPGVRDAILDRHTGVLVRAENVSGLAREAIALASNHGQSAAYRFAAIEWARRFGWDQTAQAAMEIVRAHALGRTEARRVAATTWSAT